MSAPTLNRPQAPRPAASAPAPRRSVVPVLVAVVAGLAGGFGIGQSGTVPSERYADSQRRLAETAMAFETTRSDLESANTRLTAETNRADAAEARVSDLDARVEALTATGEVPDFAGRTPRAARASRLARDLEWRIETARRPSRAKAGTIVAQTPVAGSKLRRGKPIVLTVAAPMPKQWRTIATFTGRGDRRTNEFEIPAGAKTRAVYAFTGKDDTEALLRLRAPGDVEADGDVVLDETGDHSGSTRLYDKAGTRYLEIDGGRWTVSVQVYE